MSSYVIPATLPHPPGVPQPILGVLGPVSEAAWSVEECQSIPPAPPAPAPAFLLCRQWPRTPGRGCSCSTMGDQEFEQFQDCVSEPPHHFTAPKHSYTWVGRTLGDIFIFQTQIEETIIENLLHLLENFSIFSPKGTDFTLCLYFKVDRNCHKNGPFQPKFTS